LTSEADGVAFTVRVIEQLGAQTLCVGEAGGERLRILVDRVDSWSPGQSIGVRFPAAKLHLFAKSSGQRIETAKP
jgi:ABC-type sugar transport system ATPase subunit